MTAEAYILPSDFEFRVARGLEETGWDARRFLSFDLETHRTTDTLLTPRMVCGSYATLDGASILCRSQVLDPEYMQVFDVFKAALDDPRVVLTGANLSFDLAVMANEYPELLDPIFDLLDNDRVYDILLGQGLEAIAGGHLGLNHDLSDMRKPSTNKITRRYGLEVVVNQVLGRVDAKESDEWRLRYNELDGKPIREWPEKARQYPVDDAVNTLEVAVAQVTGWGKTPQPNMGSHRNLRDMSEQCRAAFAEHLASIMGLCVDQEAVAEYEKEIWELRLSGQAKAIVSGLLRLKGGKKNIALFLESLGVKEIISPEGEDPEITEEKLKVARKLALQLHEESEKAARESYKPKIALSKDTKEIKRRVLFAAGGELCHCSDDDSDGFVGCDECDGTGITIIDGVKKTETGAVSIGREVLIEQDNEDLKALADVSKSDKAAEVYIPYLRSASPTLHPRPNVLLVTGRSSYDGVMQQMPRKGRERRCIVAELHHDLISSDYSGIEAVTWSQACIWLVNQSTMADIINGGRDIHSDFAVELMGGSMTYEEVIAQKNIKGSQAALMRQAAKVAIFGFPGGMGALRLVLAQKAQGVIICRLFGNTECVMTMVAPKYGPAVRVCGECFSRAQALKEKWLQKYPEAMEYFDRIKEIVDSTGEVPTLVPPEICASGVARIRGGVDFSAACNNFFQSLAAAGAKRALWTITRMCWGLKVPELVGVTPRFFVHDEFVNSSPEEKSDGAITVIERTMIDVMRRFTPDVAKGVKVESKKSKTWVK